MGARISKYARDLVEKILVPIPVMRVSLDDIMNHPWMKSEVAIPPLMPTYTRHEPPRDSFILEFVPEKYGGYYKPPEGHNYDRELKAISDEFKAARNHAYA